MYNRLAHQINLEVAKSLPYRGLVVDLGCGTAPYRSLILETATQYVGVDWENSQHPQTQVDVFADLSRPLPFPEAFADTVVSFQVMEHLPEPAFFLSEIYRILKPGGQVFITVPFMWHVHEEPHDYYRYTRYGLEYLLRKNGFEQIDVRENTGFWQTWILKFNYHTQRSAPRLVQRMLVPLWLLLQLIAPPLDRLNPNPHETGSYTVKAAKPT